MSTTTTRITRVSTVCVVTGDQDRAIDFYVNRLGCELRADVPFGGSYRWVEVAPPGGDTTIALAPPPESWDSVPGGVQTGITFETHDIDALHAELKAAGVDVDDEVSRMGDPVPPLLWLRDPEGNVLMVVEA
jgi:catechol 2,3-dioxygenase-like lactoylglutathione lyase family enzyme